MNPYETTFYGDPWPKIVGEGGVVGPAAAPPSDDAREERISMLCYLLLKRRYRIRRYLTRADMLPVGGRIRLQKFRDELSDLLGDGTPPDRIAEVDKFAVRMGYSL